LNFTTVSPTKESGYILRGWKTGIDAQINVLRGEQITFGSHSQPGTSLQTCLSESVCGEAYKLGNWNTEMYHPLHIEETRVPHMTQHLNKIQTGEQKHLNGASITLKIMTI
jgi:hypothetical protein